MPPRGPSKYLKELCCWIVLCHPGSPYAFLGLVIVSRQLTLNLLRISNTNSNLSAYQHLYGKCDFNSIPLAPPGTRFIVYKTPDIRKTSSTHGKQGWFIGPSLEHYHCYQVYLTKTRSEQDSNAVKIFPDHGNVPFFLSQDLSA